MKHKLAVVVRGDLRLSRGKLAVQVAHAAVICALKAQRAEPAWFRSWMEEGQRKVVLRVEGLEDLHVLEAQARKARLVAELVRDAGLTEVPPGTVTCLGVGPAPEDLVDRITGNLRLV